MLNKTSEDFKVNFLLEFTKELIRNSETGTINRLRDIVKEEETESKEEIAYKMQPLEKKVGREVISLEKKIPKPIFFKSGQIPVLRIPEPNLPLRLQYLQPTPIPVEIDLGKLNILLKDKNVDIIECNGPNQELIVRGSLGVKKTDISLTRDEIATIIHLVAQESKIPLEEGIFRVAVGRIIFLAIISKVIGSKFIIKKIKYNLPFVNPPQQRRLPTL